MARACEVMGSRPLLENVATLVAPPGSTEDEVTWLRQTLEAAGCDLLLDLHNLHANACNFGLDARALLHALPAERIAAIHLAGGRLVETEEGRRRVLDDHLHAVPEIVYELLADVGALTRRPVAVILERDGDYPPFDELLAELDRARAALAAGRRRPSINGRTS